MNKEQAFLDETLKQIDRKLKRQAMVEDGAYDGRFVTKVVIDKKTKEASKRSKIRVTEVENYVD